VSALEPGLLARTLLAPLELLFRAGVRARNAWLDRPSHVTRAPVPVVSIGNLVVGGTGKTPLVAWLSRKLANQNHYPAIDVLGSISRLMSSLASREHKQAASDLRDVMETYRASEA